ELRERARLEEELLDEPLPRDERLVEHLHGEVAVEPVVVAAVDAAHAALAEERLDAAAAEDLADRELGLGRPRARRGRGRGLVGALDRRAVLERGLGRRDALRVERDVRERPSRL